ncbi:hypothetical protein A6A19_01140 [Actinobacillus delphinicola]|uniref:Lipoprotein n=1 Tax=Actinobacillus delphinicola TaxID=51161 RepID=A0A448TVV0_9PAST|nr:hypothetical protein [Actinobacillus delphinicola]MDG6896634.1 hypothetical protein [Actinobacillus delphinicola]VEJ10065.1 Uncharacterised protein [Actinobacillus delphinicola]
MKFRTKLLPVMLLPILISGCSTMDGVMGQIKDKMNEAQAMSAAKPENLSQVCRDYSSNEVMARRKWDGRYVSTSGRITSIQDLFGGLNLGIEGHGYKFIAKDVTGIDVSQLRNGEKIHVKGIISMPIVGCYFVLNNAIISY